MYDSMKERNLSEKIDKAIGRDFPSAIKENKIVLIIVLITFASILGITIIATTEGDNPVREVVKEKTKPVRKNMEKTAKADKNSIETLEMFIRNNLTVMVWTIGMGIGFGLYPIYQLVMNSSIIGYVGVEAARETSTLRILSILMPHGVFEITGLILSIGVGLKLGITSIICIKNRNLEPLKKVGKTISPIIPPMFILVIIAAFIETFISPITGGLMFNLSKIIISAIILALIILWITGRLTTNDDQ